MNLKAASWALQVVFNVWRMFGVVVGGDLAISSFDFIVLLQVI